MSKEGPATYVTNFRKYSRSPILVVDIELIYRERIDCIENLKYPTVCQSVKEKHALYILSNIAAQVF